MNRCRSCRTLYVANPDAESAEHYDSYYDGPDRTAPDVITNSLERTLRSFEPYRCCNRILDVGFGRGELMEQAARLGWCVKGTEVAAGAARSGATRGFDVFHGPIEDAPFETGEFDVVTAVEVVEHVPRPLSMLTAMSRMLRPGGLLWLTTPHGRGISIRLLGLRWDVVSPPEHLQLFSIAGLYRLLERVDLRVERLHSQSVNPIELANGLVKRPRRESRVESGRRLLETTSTGSVLPVAVKMIQGTLRRARLGDSLRAWAVKLG